MISADVLTRGKNAAIHEAYGVQNTPFHPLTAAYKGESGIIGRSGRSLVTGSEAVWGMWWYRSESETKRKSGRRVGGESLSSLQSF